MHALSATISRRKIPGSPMASTTSTANSVIGSVNEAISGAGTAIQGSRRAAGHALACTTSSCRYPVRHPYAAGALRGELDARLAEVIDGGRFILGPEVEGFEREFAAYLGARHVVGVANRTDAITLALRAMGVGAGDEVVVPSFTFYASAERSRRQGRGRCSATSIRRRSA